MSDSVKRKYQDIGLLILRIGIGLMFVLHGYGKILGGPVAWERLGKAMSYLGIHFVPQLFGLSAAISEFGGGICLVLGVFSRIVSFFMFFTMFVAASMHLGQGDGFSGASHAIEAGIVFFSLIFIGPGYFSLDRFISKIKH